MHAGAVDAAHRQLTRLLQGWKCVWCVSELGWGLGGAWGGGGTGHKRADYYEEGTMAPHQGEVLPWHKQWRLALVPVWGRATGQSQTREGGRACMLVDASARWQTSWQAGVASSGMPLPMLPLKKLNCIMFYQPTWWLAQ